MNGLKKPVLIGAGYLAFFVFALVVLTYLTFDPGIFTPTVVSGLKSWQPLENKNITIGGIDRYRLFSLELHDISISDPAPAASPEEAARPFVIDRLIVSPKLLSLPGLFRSLKAGQTPEASPSSPVIPEVSLSSYTIMAANGKVKGRLEMGSRKFVFTADIKDPLDLSKITVPVEKFQDLKLGGKLSGEMSFEMPDLKEQSSLKGDIQIELDQLSIKDLKIAGIEEFVLDMDQGTLIAKMDGPKVNIETFKLQGSDLPITIAGSVTLNKDNFRASLLDLKGSIVVGQSFKDKNPLVGNLIQSNKNFIYQGTLDNLAPGVF